MFRIGGGGNEGESPIQRKIREAEERKQQQQDRLSKMSDKDKAKWGFKPGETLEEKQERDESENPSR